MKHIEPFWNNLKESNPAFFIQALPMASAVFSGFGEKKTSGVGVRFRASAAES